MSDILKIISELCSYQKEREWFEFKVNWFHADQLGEYISAISNSAALDGRRFGYFVWGIDDSSHKIVGTSFDCNQDVKNEPLKHYLSRQLSPDLDFVFDEGEAEGRRIVLLTIPAAKTVPTSWGRDRYIRIGSSKENLRKYPEKESSLFYILRTGRPSIENTASAYQDLTFNKLQVYYGAKGLKLNQDTFKKNMSFYTEEGKFNILAQLLSDDSRIPLRVAVFAGTTKADPMYSVQEFGYQCLPYTLDDVLRLGDVLNTPQADERKRIVERKEVSLFDSEAFREAVVNAIVHNKWVELNAPMISVFSDRIEILSRGSLAPEQTIDGFFAGESIPVNRKLAEIMLQLHISERTGRGVPVITRRYGREAFEFRENSIVVTIPFERIHAVSFLSLGEEDGDEDKLEDKSDSKRKLEDKLEDKSDSKRKLEDKPEDNSSLEEISARGIMVNSEDTFAGLTLVQIKIYNEIRKNPNITWEGLERTLDRKQSTIAKGISVLKSKGYIERIGSNKSGHWKILGPDD